jgi:lipid II isoglutaminyl synthase (glutamine-hydrolysing)
MRLRLVHLYPDLMNVYGDRGNIISLQRRCTWRGIELEVQPVGMGDRLNPRDCDVIFFGGGQDREQAVISPDFVQQKGPAVRDAAESGAVILAVCGGYQLLGHTYTTYDGRELEGVGVFDARSVPGDRRHIGNIVIETSLGGRVRTLVGFENHSGRTYLGPGCAPLGRVLVGSGNNGDDGTEGAVHRNAVGCYLHGSLLPKNPWLADELLARAVMRRYGEDARLEQLDDGLEQRAHDAVVERARQLRGVRSGAW